MNLGDVREKTVPKMTIISAPESGHGAISTRTFIPHRCHASIGVLGAVSVATAALILGTPIAEMAVVPQGPNKSVVIEHPSGATTIIVNTALDGTVEATAVLRTARKLFDGHIN